jgi:hypothetical protein
MERQKQYEACSLETTEVEDEPRPTVMSPPSRQRYLESLKAAKKRKMNQERPGEERKPDTLCVPNRKGKIGRTTLV